MVTMSDLDALALEDKTPAYWKRFILTNLTLAAGYLEAMEHVERIEDLKRLEGDEYNSLQFFAGRHYRCLFEVEGMEEAWKSEKILEAAIKRINHLVRQIEAAPTYNEFFPRMAAVRPKGEDEQYGLPSTIFVEAILFAFAKLTTANLPDNLGDQFLKGMADTYEEHAQWHWRNLAKYE
jgi:hypothetical protein